MSLQFDPRLRDSIVMSFGAETNVQTILLNFQGLAAGSHVARSGLRHRAETFTTCPCAAEEISPESRSQMWRGMAIL